MTSKRAECPRCGIPGHVLSKCKKPFWWKRDGKPAPKPQQEKT